MILSKFVADLPNPPRLSDHLPDGHVIFTFFSYLKSIQGKTDFDPLKMFYRERTCPKFGRTDGRTDRRTDGQTENVKEITNMRHADMLS